MLRQYGFFKFFPHWVITPYAARKLAMYSTRHLSWAIMLVISTKDNEWDMLPEYSPNVDFLKEEVLLLTALKAYGHRKLINLTEI